VQKNNFEVATLSRGYKRKTSGFVLATEESTALEIGDEPLLFKQKHHTTVAVDANRVNGIKRLLELNENVHTVLLDDVLQHRSIKCGLNILVSDFNKLYVHDQMLPYGTLRESSSGAHRADIIVVSKTPEKTSAVEIRTIIKDINPLAHQKVFFSYLNYGDLYHINNFERKINAVKQLYEYTLIVFTGIANPLPMITYLKEYSANLKHLPFPDHHEFTINDLKDIEKYYNGFDVEDKILVTTEKDFMRLKNKDTWEHAQTLNIFILPIEISFKDKEEEFNTTILTYARANKLYHQKYT
jgi:tetraacyldisaccharide 4'-kinase